MQELEQGDVAEAGDKFTYDKGKNVYMCPAGKELITIESENTKIK